ncbi:MAG: hypothetical protein KF729_06055 [Sandaracinaceae bacterium]|nr:hypothetical protein [Sandaracinaceae bacterium]
MTPTAVENEPTTSFRERFRDFQYVAQELCLLERYNRAALADHREGELRLHSFLALTLLALERFLRMVLGANATDSDTLPNLLEMATGGRNKVFELSDREKTLRFVNETRRVVMHGKLGVTDEAEHLLGYLLPLSFDLYEFTNQVVACWEPLSGAARPGARVSFTPRHLAPDGPKVVLTPIEELISLNRHNKTYGPHDPQDGLLMFAEGALCMTLIEAAARRWVGDGVLPADAKFRPVLKAAAASGLRIPFDDADDGITKLCAVKNTLVHGNFEQAARGAGGRDVATYFKEQYAGEIERMYRVCLHFLTQVQERDGQTKQASDGYVRTGPSKKTRGGRKKK